MSFIFIPFLAQTTPVSPFDNSGYWLFVKTVLAMLLVIGLAFIFIKYILPKLYLQKIKGRGNIEILEKITLEPRKSLYVIRAGNKAVLLGLSDQKISRVMDLDLKDWEGDN